MKKFLAMLMVVAMVSFLFVGCIPGVTPDVDEEEEEVEGPASTAPVIDLIAASGAPAVAIINLYSSATQYMNKAEVYYGIIVKGNAPKYSEVNVYVDDEVVGTGVAYGVAEDFTVFVAKADLGADGAKTLYATATETGLTESAHSTEYAFTLDVVAPAILSAKADSSDGFVTVTFDEPVNTSLNITTSASTIAAWAKSAVNFAANWVIATTICTTFTPSDCFAVSNTVIRITGTGLIVSGVPFTVSCLGIGDLAGNTMTSSSYSGLSTP